MRPRVGGPPLVAHLAPGHVPLDTRVFHKEARTLAEAGYRVVVVAPGAESTTVDRVRVVALRPWGSRWERFVLGPVRLARAAWRLRADVYHLHDIEAWPLAPLLRLRRARVVIDSHEDYPRLALDRPWLPRWSRGAVSRGVRALERLATRPAHAIVSAEARGAERFPAARTTVLANLPLAREFEEPGPPLAERSPVVAYVGALSAQRGALEMVDAVGRLPARLGARLVLAGPIGEPDLRARLAASPGWARTDHLGRVDRATVRSVLDGARVGIVLWHPTRKHAEGAVPVKLYEYLAAGVAVVASDLPAIREVVEAAGAGLLVDPFDAAALGEALERLLTDDELAVAMGERGRRFVFEERTWEHQAPALVELYARILGGRARS